MPRYTFGDSFINTIQKNYEAKKQEEMEEKRLQAQKDLENIRYSRELDMLRQKIDAERWNVDRQMQQDKEIADRQAEQLTLQYNENVRHNKKMEDIQLGQVNVTRDSIRKDGAYRLLALHGSIEDQRLKQIIENVLREEHGINISGFDNSALGPLSNTSSPNTYPFPTPEGITASFEYLKKIPKASYGIVGPSTVASPISKPQYYQKRGGYSIQKIGETTIGKMLYGSIPLISKLREGIELNNKEKIFFSNASQYLTNEEVRNFIYNDMLSDKMNFVNDKEASEIWNIVQDFYGALKFYSNAMASQQSQRK